jgi:hypothetical protein
MDILAALRKEEGRLQHQLKGIQGAIASLNGHSVSRSVTLATTGMKRKRTMSAAGKARISKATKARWAKYRAEKAKKSK